jgi:S-adenosylmethionine synthetase
MRTAEFVSPKHPDKLCDIISDTILDMFLTKDPNIQCTIQTMGGYGKVWITGEVSTSTIPYDEITQIVKDVSGINDTSIHLISRIPNNKRITNDQGIIIGYATLETPTFMPFEYELARSLNKYIYDIYPTDGKTQITINGTDARVVASFQNTKAKDLEELIHLFFNENGERIANQKFRIANTHCNPMGDWDNGGLYGDTGISGAKIVMDNYGPRIPIGGGSYSGKDASHIDRCAGYMARKIAIDSLSKHKLVYSLVELSYTMDESQPIQARIKGNDKGITVETGIKLYEVVGYDLSIKGIIDYLGLGDVEFSKITEWGAFGNNFYWK